MADSDGQPEGKGAPSQEVQWKEIIGALAALVSVLAFFGITNFAQLRHIIDPSSRAAAYPPDTPTTSYQPITTTTTTRQPVPSTTPTDEPVPSTTPPFDPSTLDNAATDKTPFTEAALLPATFTDSMGQIFSLVAGGRHACGESYAMSINVQYILNQYGCTEVMTGDYRRNNGIITDGNEIMVSVQVFRFDSATTARQVSNGVYASWPRDLGIFCPMTGLGRDDCTSSYENAQKMQSIRPDHRYLIQATALYTNLTSDSLVQNWISSAAWQASAQCGPENYTGNH